MNISLIFAALGDPVRMELCKIMAQHQGLLCVDQLVAEVNARLGRNIQQPTVSHHLSTLRKAGLVYCHRIGNWVYYSFEHEVFEQAMRATQAAFCTMAEVA